MPRMNLLDWVRWQYPGLMNNAATRQDGSNFEMSYTLYDPPAPLVGYIRKARPTTPHAVRMKTLREQWARIVDAATFEELAGAMRVTRLGNGRLKVTFNEVDLTVRDDSVVFTAAYQSVTPVQATRYIAAVVPWLTVSQGFDGQSFYMAPIEGTSGLRRRAFHEALHEFNHSWTSREGGETVMTINPSTFQGADGERVCHVSLGQLVWLHALAVRLNRDLTGYMRRALAESRESLAKYEVPTHNTRGNFLDFLRRRRDELVDNGGELIGNLPVLDPNTPTARTWGIEVEAAGARGVEEPPGWERKEDGSLESAYDSAPSPARSPSNCPHHDHNEFIEDPDGNEVENPDYEDPDYCDWLYYEDYDSYDDCAEFVSPVLTRAGSHGLLDLMDALSREPQNDTAGIHVHVGAKDLTPKQIGNLVLAYAMIEPIITPYYQRDTRGYCKDLQPDSVVQAMAQAKAGERPDLGDRYFSVNLWALQSHGTIEFRSMGPVYEYEPVIKWALFCREMVSIAKAETVPPKVWTSVKSWADIERILRVHGPELQAHALGKLDFEPATFSQYLPRGEAYAY